MKIYACVLVAVSIIVYGIYDSLKYRKNTRAIEEILSFISMVANEIHYKNTSYPDLMLLGENQGYQYISFAGNEISVNCDVAIVKNDFLHFVEGLGTTDIQGQLSFCDEYSEKIKGTFDKRRAKEEARIQINISLSFLCAVSVIVVFI